MIKKHKICHLSSVHSRYDIRIFIKQCISLAKSGYSVSFVVADGLGDEELSGVKIYDVGISSGRLKRIFFTTRKVYKKARDLKCDLYHFHDPELMFYGLKLMRLKSKVIYDIHEDLAKQLEIKPWINKYIKPSLIRAFIIYEKFVCKRLDALIVPQPYMKKNYEKINNNTKLVENFVILEDETNDVDYSNFNAFHPGALSEERGLLNMLNVYAILESPNKLILAGNISKNLLNKINNFESLENVEYLGLISFKEVQKQYQQSSIGLILYNNVGQYYLSYAIKLFEYMRKGIPVIMPNFGEWIEFNNINQCGINVNPQNESEVKDAINFLNNNPSEKKRLGLNGYKAVNEKYNWKIAKNKLLKLYYKLLN